MSAPAAASPRSGHRRCRRSPSRSRACGSPAIQARSSASARSLVVARDAGAVTAASARPRVSSSSGAAAAFRGRAYQPANRPRRRPGECMKPGQERRKSAHVAFRVCPADRPFRGGAASRAFSSITTTFPACRWLVSIRCRRATKVEDNSCNERIGVCCATRTPRNEGLRISAVMPDGNRTPAKSR